MSSLATTTGIGFPGIARVVMVDTVNGYVLAKLKPWTVYAPGFDQMNTYSPTKTYTNSDFQAVSSLSITAANIDRGTYDAHRDVWTYPAGV